ncbi:hypothetical protein KUTeg_018637 [Tegillarca granosa]|uniref:Uncharacterized protein n=1 Tax=Tegillarca granosa TaxID=220873 RepID=A0ABQ9EHC1_TEGGR|nr:hypothetical protein KUTeg_018637 [Tegillarca granosa]
MRNCFSLLLFCFKKLKGSNSNEQGSTNSSASGMDMDEDGYLNMKEHDSPAICIRYVNTIKPINNHKNIKNKMIRKKIKYHITYKNSSVRYKFVNCMFLKLMFDIHTF